MKIEVFSDVEPNPSTNTVYAGTKMMVDFKPDTVIALGGGSAMDAAKACGCSMNTQIHLSLAQNKILGYP